MKPTARWWSKLLPTPAPNRKTHLTSSADWELTHCLPGLNLCVYFHAGTVFREDGDCCTSWQPSIAALMSWSHFCWASCRMPVPAPRCSTKVFNPPTTQHMALVTSDAIGLSADWLLLLIDRYRQGMWAESKEDFPVWRTHTVSQQHGTQSYAC